MAIHGIFGPMLGMNGVTSPDRSLHEGGRPRHPSNETWAGRFVRRTALFICLLLAGAGASVVAAAPASASCPTVTYKGVTYCAGTIADLNAGVYPAGTKIALQPVAVLSKSGTTLSLGQVTPTFTSQPCPPGMVCGAGTITCTETWQKSTSDFATVNPRPVVGSAVNVYGKVTTTRTFVPAAWALVGASYQNNGNFHPCWYL